MDVFALSVGKRLSVLVPDEVLSCHSRLQEVLQVSVTLCPAVDVTRVAMFTSLAGL